MAHNAKLVDVRWVLRDGRWDGEEERMSAVRAGWVGVMYVQLVDVRSDGKWEDGGRRGGAGRGGALCVKGSGVVERSGVRWEGWCVVVR